MKKSIAYFFTKTYGISHSLAFKMCSFINVAPIKEIETLSDLKKKQAFNFLKSTAINKKIGLNLKNIELNTLIHYNTINHIKGFKFRCFLPINGQRNKRNAKTAKKNAMTLFNLIGKSKFKNDTIIKKKSKTR